MEEKKKSKRNNQRQFLIKWGIALVVLCFAIWWAERLNIEQNKYHKTYATPIQVDTNGIVGLEGLEADLEGKEIIFTAESHGVDVNMELERGFIKYFKEKTNFKYYLCELSYAQSIMLNKYLEIGDPTILDEMFAHFKGTFAYTEDSYRRWIWLYSFNQTLPEEDRIQVVGVDVEHQVAYAAEVLSEMMPDTTAPAEIQEIVQLIKDGQLKQLDEIQKVYDDVVANRSLYEAYLVENYFDVELILKNMINFFKVNEDDKYFDRERDRCMYETFMAIYPKLPKDIFYGQWGLNHAFKRAQGGIKWIASEMEANDFKDKVLSIAYAYNNCSRMSKKNDLTYGERPLTNVVKPTLAGLPREDLVLLPLHKEDSPYAEKLLWPYKTQMTYEPTGGVTTDYFDYLLVIQNAGPTRPLE
ncbi:MAG: hypothetical protein ACRDDX_05130 [Cellulosilyticaceae bacterium]